MRVCLQRMRVRVCVQSHAAGLLAVAETSNALCALQLRTCPAVVSLDVKARMLFSQHILSIPTLGASLHCACSSGLTVGELHCLASPAAVDHCIVPNTKLCKHSTPPY